MPGRISSAENSSSTIPPSHPQGHSMCMSMPWRLSLQMGMVGAAPIEVLQWQAGCVTLGSQLLRPPEFVLKQASKETFLSLRSLLKGTRPVSIPLHRGWSPFQTFLNSPHESHSLLQCSHHRQWLSTLRAPLTVAPAPDNPPCLGAEEMAQYMRYLQT